jgi:hypothetical protein
MSTGGIVEHMAIREGHQIGAVGHVRRLQRDARAGGFDRRAAGVVSFAL